MIGEVLELHVGLAVFHDCKQERYLKFQPYHDRMGGYLSASTGKSVLGCQHRLGHEVLLVSFCLRGLTEDCSMRNGVL